MPEPLPVRAFSFWDNSIDYLGAGPGTNGKDVVSTLHMRIPARLYVISTLAFLALSALQVHACQCGIDMRYKNLRERAEKRAKSYAAVFEGRVKRISLNIPAVTAKIGDVISADDPYSRLNAMEMVRVDFDVSRVYRGTKAKELAVYTGFGGGDCGAGFSTGTDYLVYAAGSDLNHLSVSMCSPGGIVGSERTGADLRYLRGERPTAGDVAAWKPDSLIPKTEQEKRYQEATRFREKATGKICGKINRNEGHITFIATAGSSFGDAPWAYFNEDGTFCSGALGPGTYYLLYTKRSEHGPSEAVFYPDVTDRSRAQRVEINAGQTRNDVVFNISPQSSYSVRGLISTNDKSNLDSESVSLALIPVDAPVRSAIHARSIDFSTSVPLPKTKYFSFEHVAPGRYFVWINVMRKGWYTKKTEVTVTNHSKFITLELIHQK